jgi:hypothetical protein
VRGDGCRRCGGEGGGPMIGVRVALPWCQVGIGIRVQRLERLPQGVGVLVERRVREAEPVDRNLAERLHLQRRGQLDAAGLPAGRGRQSSPQVPPTQS